MWLSITGTVSTQQNVCARSRRLRHECGRTKSFPSFLAIFVGIFWPVQFAAHIQMILWHILSSYYLTHGRLFHLSHTNKEHTEQAPLNTWNTLTLTFHHPITTERRCKLSHSHFHTKQNIQNTHTHTHTRIDTQTHSTEGREEQKRRSRKRVHTTNKQQQNNVFNHTIYPRF